MKITVTKENLKKIVNSVSHVVAATVTLPILSNILLETEKGRIKISATNLEIGLTAWLGGRVEEEGRVTIPARTFNDYVSSLLGEQVGMEAKKGTLNISTEAARAELKTLPPDEFPLIPKFETTSEMGIAAGVLKSVLSEIIFSAA